VQLSVIIVNYNVRYFLEQCLHSVLRAVKEIEAEIIVVDNHSADDSVSWLEPLFPSVRFIANEQNLGFAKANNQALKTSRGEYVLFLNPDTLVPEDCFQKCIAFLQTHPQTGALGVQMLDGRGKFLPESKRAFPSPMASFYKLTGLAALFPRSNTFNHYALGGLDETKDHEVPVLAGAFLMGRAALLQSLNGFDEDYFLYGEDIDLSYRINQAGWKNQYFAGSSIIHFKGESSGKAPLDRVTHFYRAMRIFVQKHYRGKSERILLFFINLAIWCRAGISFLNRLIKPVLLPLIDAGLVWLSLQVTRMAWIKLVRGGVDFHVPFIRYALPLFAVLFVVSAALAGLYDRTYRSSRGLAAMVLSIVATLAVYALLPESLRFSRGVMIIGSLVGALLILWFRFSVFIKWYVWLGYEWEHNGQMIVVGDEESYAKVKSLLENSFSETQLLGRVAPGDWAGDALCRLKDLPELLRTESISEIVFCVGDQPLTATIYQIKALQRTPHLLFHMRGSNSIVGSDMRAAVGRTLGWSYGYRIAEPYQQRMKRMTDVLIGLICLLTTPVHLLVFKNARRVLKNGWLVLTGGKTWVGYLLPEESLPPLPTAVMPQSIHLLNASSPIQQRSDRIWARNYDWWQDTMYIFSQYRKWDR
jgi:GT2 family glycosyltransferase